MKKIISALSCVLAVMFVISCGSTPEPEPEPTVKDVVEEVNEGIEAGNLPIKVDSEEYNKYISHVVEKRVKDEIKRGVQMIQYQVITLMTTNGF